MHSIGIATDSHASIPAGIAASLGVRVLPMPFTINGQDYLEGVTLSREEFFAFQREGAEIATSQPAPADVMALWDAMLEEYESVLYMPMTSGLSGSYATAAALAEDEPYQGRVFVVDTGRIATPLHVMVADAVELVQQGLSAQEARARLEASRDNVTIYIAVDTLTYLKKGGRISPAAAAIGTVLNIKPILKLATGKLDAFRKTRGFNKAREAMIEAIRSDLTIRFKDAHARGEVTLMAATSASAEETAAWVQEIEAAFPGMPVVCDNLSLGVSCHTGEGALGIGLCCKP